MKCILTVTGEFSTKNYSMQMLLTAVRQKTNKYVSTCCCVQNKRQQSSRKLKGRFINTLLRIFYPTENVTEHNILCLQGVQDVGVIQEVLRTCPGCIWNVFAMCSERVRDVSGTCPGRVRDVSVGGNATERNISTLTIVILSWCKFSAKIPMRRDWWCYVVYGAMIWFAVSTEHFCFLIFPGWAYQKSAT